MKILITGAAGFLAQDIIQTLKKNGHEIIGIDNFSKYSKSFITSPIEIIEGDARDEDLVSHYLKGQDCFIPMAAMVGGIDYFHQNPFTIMSYNDALTQTAFSCAIKLKISRMLLISSSMVFENIGEGLLLEESLANAPAPKSSYGFQKLNLEKYAEFAWREFKLPCEIIRPFNGVGTSELQNIESVWSQVKNREPTHLHVIPELLLKALLNEKSIEIYGNGDQVRCFTSTKDIASGIDKILSREFDKLRYYHLSSGNAVKIKDLAQMILDIARPNEDVQIKKTKAYEWDVKKRIPSLEITNSILGFEASVSLNQMIHEVYDHIKSKGLKL